MKKDQKSKVKSKLKRKPIRRKTTQSRRRSLLFSPAKMPQFGREFCFLCGITLPADRNTDEHVIPRWIQHRYDLWNLKLTLLNRTTIPYRQLTIPCCATCNNEHLSKIEAQAETACDSGREAVLKLPPATLFLWAGKIFYGLLYREHLLSWSRRDADAGPIVPAEMLERCRLHHQFLQAARIPFQFSPQVPASIFVYETLQPTERQMQFDYWDNIPGMGLSVRVGKVGIIVCLQDGGAVEHAFKKIYKRIAKVKLHWAQFAEVTARTFYDLSRFNRVPKFMLAEGKDHVHVMLSPLGGLSGKPLFDNWDMQDYAKALAFYFRCPEEQIHPEPDKVVSWLFRAGRLRQMQPDDPA
jgi:hypothetical protein